MKRLKLVSSGSLERTVATAREAWEQRDFQKSFDLLERASLLDPANASLALELGHFYGLRYDYAAAERCFERAIRIAPQKTATLFAAAQYSFDFASQRMAEQYFGRLVAQKDAPPAAFARMSELYERLDRFEEAHNLIGRALQLDGSCGQALLVRARLDRRAGRLEQAEQSLRSFVSKADRQVQIRAHYELGGILDRLGRYDEAMAEFLEAKTLLRPDLPPLLSQMGKVAAHVNEMRANLRPEMLQSWFDARSTFDPCYRLAFLGGNNRSGTTLLEQVLDSHPDIVSAEETTIFHDDAYIPLRRGLPLEAPMLLGLERATDGALRQSRASYFRSMELHLGNPIGNRLLIDKNPSITVLIPAVLRVFPEITIIVALRDPRDVCLSCFMQAHLPISKVSAAYLSLEGTVESYTRVMGTWRTLAPLVSNPYIEVRYEDVVDNLESVSRRVLEFLGVPWNQKVLHFNEHAQGKRVRSPSYADVKQPVFKTAMGRWRHYQKYFEPHLEKLEPFVKVFGYE